MPLVIPTDLFTNVLQLLGVMGAAEVAPAPEHVELLRRAFNRLGGQWNTRKRNCYFIQTQAFTFPSTKQSYTIGAAGNVPAPDFVMVTGQDRPSALEPIARLILTGATPNVYLPLAVVNFDQYTLLTVPTITATIPTTIYYQATTPNGTIFIWMEPTVLGNQLEVSWRNELTALAAPPAPDITTAVSMPDGYEEAITLSIAEKVWLAFPKRTDLEELKRQARLARSDAFSNNAPPPKISTVDGTQSGKRGGFNWLTRM